MLVQVLAASALVPGEVVRAAETRRVITSRIAVEEGRVWVSATIAGTGPHLFIIDTGAMVSLIHRRIARELRMRPLNRIELSGVGGTSSFQLYQAQDVVFAGTLRQASVIFGASDNALGYGRGAAGVLAAGMFTALDSDLDFEREEWRVYPDGRGDWAGFIALPSAIRAADNSGGSPKVFADATLDGQNYTFGLDTGMPGELVLWPGATRRSGLWSDTGAYAPRRSRGIGGNASMGRIVRGGRLAMGEIAFEQPLVGLSDPSSGGFAGAADGLIGLKLLERLNLSTDVRRSRLWAQPNARPRRLDDYGFSGLWLDRGRDRITVGEVGRGSPAAEAGLRIGDEIAGMDWPAAIAAITGPPGRTITLDIRRGGQRIPTSLVLRDFL
jgi:serine protease Do